jgi:hypothetical protein
MSEPDELEAAREDYENQLYQQFRDDVLSGRDDLSAELTDSIIESFQADRLRAYFYVHPNVAAPVVAMFREAFSMYQAGYTRAPFVLIMACVEIGLKRVLFIPILHGLIDSEPLAPLITYAFERQQRGSHFDHILAALLREHAGLDPAKHAMPVIGGTTFNQAYDELYKKRNVVIHRACEVRVLDVDNAIALARFVFDDLLVAIVRNLDLHMHGFEQICGRDHSQGPKQEGPRFRWHPTPVLG